MLGAAPDSQAFDNQSVEQSEIKMITKHLHRMDASYSRQPARLILWINNQRWSRGHKARGQGQGQGHKKNPRPRPRPRTAFPRTDTLEAKDRNARGQGQGPRTQSASALQKKKKKGLHKNFSGDLQKKKRSSQKFFKRSPRKNAFQKIFQPLHKILTFQKILLSSSRGQANFRGLEAKAKDLTFEAKAKAKDFKICPRGRPRGQGRPRGLHLCQQSMV